MVHQTVQFFPGPLCNSYVNSAGFLLCAKSKPTHVPQIFCHVGADGVMKMCLNHCVAARWQPKCPDTRFVHRGIIYLVF